MRRRAPEVMIVLPRISFRETLTSVENSGRRRRRWGAGTGRDGWGCVGRRHGSGRARPSGGFSGRLVVVVPVAWIMPNCYPNLTPKLYRAHR